MLLRRRPPFLFLWLYFSLLPSLVFATCYCVNAGEIVICGMDSTPCSGSKSDSDVSVCCVPGDTCGADSICHFTRRTENASGFYLGGCTDPTFQDPLCAGQCSGSLTSDIIYNPSTHLWSCCGYPNGTMSCQNPTSDTFAAISPDHYPGTSALSPAALSISSSTPSFSTSSTLSSILSSTPSSTSTNSPLSASTSSFHKPSITSLPSPSQDKPVGLNTGLKVGIGIACAVAAIAIAGVVFLTMRQRGRSYEKGIRMPPELDAEMHRDSSRAPNRPELCGMDTMMPAELSSSRKISELQA